MDNFLFIIFFISLFLNYKNDLLNENKGILRFPFGTKMKLFSLEKLNNSIYNETNFINDFLNNTFFINMTIGSPGQKTKIMLDQNEACFTFIQNKNQIEFNNINNTDYNKLSPYNKKESLTSNHLSTYDTKNNFEEIEDIFYLYEYFDTKNISIKNYTNFLNFIYWDNNSFEENVYLKIGLDMNNYKDVTCPRFLDSLKNKDILKKYIFYFDFYSDFHGYIYLGVEPHIYDTKELRYRDYQYLKNNTILSKDGYVNWNLLFNKIILKNKTNDYIYNLNEKMVQIDFNLGLIIGTYEYQQIIEKAFFNELINENICSKNLVEYFYDNKITKYYIYKCNESLTNGENFDKEKHKPYVNYVEIFPDFQLFHVNLENNFYISYLDLFRFVHGTYYFLIIFEAEKENKIWKLGQILLKIHQLFFDYDNKIIGYYDRRIEPPKNNQDEKNSDNNKQEETKENNNNKKEYRILIFIALFIVFCFIVYIAFYLGMKFKKIRKIRANELKDENYEYLTNDNNNENNNIINN